MFEKLIIGFVSLLLISSLANAQSKDPQPKEQSPEKQTKCNELLNLGSSVALAAALSASTGNEEKFQEATLKLAAIDRLLQRAGCTPIEKEAKGRLNAEVEQEMRRFLNELLDEANPRPKS